MCSSFLSVPPVTAAPGRARRAEAGGGGEEEEEAAESRAQNTQRCAEMSSGSMSGTAQEVLVDERRHHRIGR